MLNNIRLTQPLDPAAKNIILQLQENHKEKVEGIYSLYDQLLSIGEAESYNLDRILYVAYTLASKNIDFKLEV